MSRSDKLLNLDLNCRWQTENAYGFKGPGAHASLIWCPKSLVQEEADGTYTMPEWLVIEKGLDSYVVP